MSSASGRQEEAHRMQGGSPHLDIFEPRPVLSGGLEAVLGQEAESLGGMSGGILFLLTPFEKQDWGRLPTPPHMPCMLHCTESMLQTLTLCCMCATVSASLRAYDRFCAAFNAWSNHVAVSDCCQAHVASQTLL